MNCRAVEVLKFRLQDPTGSAPTMLPRTRLLKIVLVLLCLISILLITTLNANPKPKEPELTKEVNSALDKKTDEAKEEKFKLFHLDLKGAPPKMSYLLKILPLAKKAGANGLLIEYEDMFPWSGKLKNLSAGNAYTRNEVKDLLTLAKDLRMEVIPLVQTFGHLEFMLKLPEFRHLRELDSFPQEICPSKNEALQIIKEMVHQVMEMHESSKFLHIGCDEVYHISACSTCSLRNPRQIFITHVTHVGEHVRATYPGVTPIIWDDMMRHWAPMDIQDSALGKIVEPMVWVYIDDISRLVPHFIWYVYKKTFPRIWAASAFKGAFGEKESLPDLPRHLDNQLAWLRLMNPHPKESTVMSQEDFRGIVMTGWSRYDHFAILAELLPVSIPSLILSITLVDTYLKAPFGSNVEGATFDKIISILHCPQSFPFRSIEEMRNDKHQWIFGSCLYPGNNLYPVMQEYFNLQMRLASVLEKKNSNGWVTDYNVRHNYSSPFRVLELFPEEGFGALVLKKSVKKLKLAFSGVLAEYYDRHTVKEWLEQKFEPMEKTLFDLEKTMQYLVEFKTWPRRPLM